MTIVLSTFFASAVFCGVYLYLARRLQLVATPDHRSSHTDPTPHGGGVALIAAFIFGVTLVHLLGAPWQGEYLFLVCVMVLLAALGIADDMLELSVRLRLGLYTLLSACTAAVLLPVVGGDGLWPAVFMMLLAAFAMLSFLNIYNFMDGIDGIAALQVVFACSAAALLSWSAAGDAQYRTMCLLFAASHLGFLLWNWPPAKLFMGDAGSVPTGFLLAALAILGAAQGAISGWSWLILLAVFITDAAWTLVWRVATKQKFTQPHRSHAYQKLSRYWASHLKVDMAFVAVNFVWLFPLAWLAQANPEYALFLVILAYLPLLALMAKMGRLA